GGGGEMPDDVILVVTVTVPGTAGTGDTFEIVRIPTTARIFQLDIANACFAATTFTWDVGLQKSLASGTTAFDASVGDSTALASAIQLGTSATPLYTNRLGTGSKPAVANNGKAAWELAGATSDPSLVLATAGPFTEYTVVAKANTITGAV